MPTGQTAVVTGIYIVAPGSPSLASSPVQQAQATLEGFAGDRHAGWTRAADARTPEYPRGTPIRNNRQVTIVSAEELAAIAQSLQIPLLKPEWLGANLCLSGIDHLTQLPPLTRIFFPQGLVLILEGENEPCRGPGRLIQEHYPETHGLAGRFVKAAYRRRGVIACVERAGQAVLGDEVRIVLPPLQ